jgi:predicted XRE-type DNA-binding protein
VLTQTQIAEALSVDQSIVSRWRSGNVQKVDYLVGAAMLALHRKNSRRIAAAKKKQTA